MQQRNHPDINAAPLRRNSYNPVGNKLQLVSSGNGVDGGGGGGYRKTSAEIISEARTLLAGGGGVRLVSTRRPITPREPRRQLYGKLAPPGRPPSAFSLQYLQFESSRQIPSLEPIQQQQASLPETIPIVLRSGSVGTLLDFVSANNETNNNNNNNNNRLQGKLPALLCPPKITASLDNLSEEMPPHSTLIQNAEKEQDVEKNRNEEHPLKKRQAKSFDLPTIKSVESNFELKWGKNAQQQPKKASIPKEGKTKGSGNQHQIKTRLTRSNDLLAQSSTETLLDLLKGYAGIKDCNEETVQHIHAILIELYTRVKGAKGSWRGAILGALYGLVECSSPKILLAVARVVLALCVTGSNLTGACKLVFKVARNETNDYLFADSDVPELLIDGLGRASPIDEPEACIYGYGAVRFLASGIQSGSASAPTNPNNNNNKTPMSAANILAKQKSIAHRLARHGAVQLMVLHLQILNESGATQKLSGPPLHALYQLAAALRALAGIPQVVFNSKNQRPFTANQNEIESGDHFPIIKETKEVQEIRLELACPHLIKAAEISIGEVEIQSNIVRTLSVLSEHDPCCQVLSEFSARIGMLLGPCNEITGGIPEKPLALLSRLGYILGNIMAKFDDARIQFYNNDVAMQYLLEALEIYSKQKLTIHNQMGDTVVDVLIKLVRVIANMSVNPDVGFALGTKSPLGEILLHLLVIANTSKGLHMGAELDELLQATLGALHNLSFYQDTADTNSRPGGNDISNNNEAGSVRERMSALSVVLCDTLKFGPESAKAEASRVLGNMTRNPIARESFCSAGGLKTIVQCLGSNEYELIATSSGVLVNLLGDWERRAPFRELRGPIVLREILKKSVTQEDWLLAEIVCQALWNFLIDSGNVMGTLGEEEADYISENLAEYLDEDRIFKGEPPDALWEQFATVAADLLERIQSSMSSANTPLDSDGDDSEIKIKDLNDDDESWLDE